MKKKLLLSMVLSSLLFAAAPLVALVREINPPLIEAAGYNDLDKVRELLQQGAMIDERNERGKTALIIAVELGHYDMAQLLIEKGADVDVTAIGDRFSCTEEDTPDSPVVCAQVLPGGTPPFTVRVGWTALHYAIDRQNQKMVSLLLDNGADANVTGAFKTPLMLASQKGDRVVVRMLLDHGAQVDAHNKGNRTALYYAVAYADKNEGALAVIKELLRAGAHVDKDIDEVKNKRKNKTKIAHALAGHRA